MRPVSTTMRRTVCLATIAWLAHPFPVAAYDDTSDAAAIAPPNSASLAWDATQTGAAHVSYGFEVAGGRLGLTPELVLDYSSQRGTYSPYGLGWELHASFVRRSTKKGLHYALDEYEFVENGAAIDLVPCARGTACLTPEYTRKVDDGRFLRFLRRGSGWVVLEKSGVRRYYGHTPESRHAESLGGSSVFAWHLNGIRDRRGNYVDYRYSSDSGRPYLTRIDYTGRVSVTTADDDRYVDPSVQAPVVAPNHRISFHTAPSSLSRTSYRPFFAVVERLLVDRIDVTTNHAPGAGSPEGAIFASYHLGYDGKDRLQTFQRFGADGAAAPAVTFTPAALGKPAGAQTSWSTPGLSILTYDPDVVHPYNHTVFGDFNSDGRTDVAYIERNWTYWKIYFSNGGGFDAPVSRSTQDAQSFWQGDYQDYVYVGDFDGDGSTDLAHTRSEWKDGFVYALHNLLSDNSFRTVWASSAPYTPIGAGSVYTHTGDFDGDGATDIYVVPATGSSAILYLSRLRNNGTSIEPVSWPFAMAPYQLGTDTRIYAADFNGDGRTDLAYTSRTGSTWRVALSTGAGFDDTAWNRGVPVGTNCSGSNKCFVVIRDFNADGLDDVRSVSCSDSSATWRESLSTGKGFAPVREWTESTCPDWIAAGDFDGDRAIDVQSGKGLALSAAELDADGFSDRIGVWQDEALTVVPGGGDGPSLLGTIDNGAGGVTTFTYDRYSAAWNHPFPVPVLKRVELRDSVRTAIVLDETDFAYSGAYYDTREREFRGFNQVDATRADGRVVSTRYQQFDNPRPCPAPAPGICYDCELPQYADAKGLPTSVTVTALDGNYQKTTYRWARFPSDLSEYPAFVRVASKRVVASLEPSSTCNVQGFLETYTHDVTNGNLLSVRHAPVFPGGYAGPAEETVTTTYEYRDYGTWLWRRTLERLSGSTSGQVRETEWDYLSDTGEPKWTRRWLNGGTDLKTAYTYHDDGALKSERHASKPTVDAGGGRETSFDYDETRSYASTTTLPSTVDAATGSTVSHSTGRAVSFSNAGSEDCVIDENGNRSCTFRDTLQRVVKTVAFIGNPSPPYDGAAFAMETRTVYGIEDPQVGPNWIQTFVRETDVEEATPKYIETSKTYLDVLGRPWRVHVPRGKVSTSGERTIAYDATIKLYDWAGRPAGSEGPFASDAEFDSPPPDDQHPWSRVTYDFLGRATRVEQNHGLAGGSSFPGQVAVSTVGYTGLWTATATNADENKTTFVTDSTGRLVQRTDYAANGTTSLVTTYTYDAAGDLRKIDPGSRTPSAVVSIDVDTLGRQSALTDPDAGKWEYVYDPDYGTLNNVKDPRARAAGQDAQVTFTYDALDRVLTRTGQDGSVTTFAYDSATNGKGMVGNVTTSDANGLIRSVDVTEYDVVGRVRSETRNVRGQTEKFTTTSDYDVAGRLTGITYPGTDAFRLTYAYYPGVMELKSVSSDAQTFATFSNYAPGGRVGTIAFGNGASQQNYYDPSSLHMTGTRLWGPGNAALDLGYEVSGGENVSASEDYLAGPSVPNGVLRAGYVYDGLNRMNREVLSAPIPGARGFSPPLQFLPHSTLAHAYRAAVFNGTQYGAAYDANGNLVSGYDFSVAPPFPRRLVTYSSDNKPLSIACQQGLSTSTTSFLYSGDDRVLKTDTVTGATTYVSDLHEIVGGERVRFVFAGFLRIAMIDAAGKVYYFHKDRNDSTVAVTATGGALAWSGSYAPHGALRQESTPLLSAQQVRYLFTDHEFDPETRLYFFGARYYDPATARFITPDTLIPRVYDPQSLNRYAYARNSPVTRVDPDGQWDLPSWWDTDTSAGWAQVMNDSYLSATYALSDGRYFDSAAYGGNWLLNGAIFGAAALAQGLLVNPVQQFGHVVHGNFMGNDREASDAGVQLGSLVWTAGMASLEQSVARTAAREVSFAVKVAEPAVASRSPATVEELMAMMNQRPGVTAQFETGDMLRYLELKGAEGSHTLLEGGQSLISLRPGASRWGAFHEWMHRSLQLRRGAFMPGEDEFIENFLMRHQRLFKIGKPAGAP